MARDRGGRAVAVTGIDGWTPIVEPVGAGAAGAWPTAGCPAAPRWSRTTTTSRPTPTPALAERLTGVRLTLETLVAGTFSRATLPDPDSAWRTGSDQKPAEERDWPRPPAAAERIFGGDLGGTRAGRPTGERSRAATPVDLE